jgi:copper chaperone
MIRLEVEGMTCNHCVMAVKKALLKIPGVKDAQVFLDRKEALVEGEADPTLLVRAVEEEGYRARVREA